MMGVVKFGFPKFCFVLFFLLSLCDPLFGDPAALLPLSPTHVASLPVSDQWRPLYKRSQETELKTRRLLKWVREDVTARL